MSTPLSDLADLRRRIDGIDDRMHDLLMERAEIVARVAATKSDGDVAFYQPAREAQILRRLAARHHGFLPLAGVLRIWRELLATTVGLETPFAIAVFAPPRAQSYWDLARDHYGSHTPISAYGSTREVIRAVREDEAAVGILPLPQEAEPDPWWRHLAPPNNERLGVMARLPFGPRGNARSNGCDALVIGRGTQQQTGMDRTLFITELASGFSRTRFLDHLSSAGLNCTFSAYSEHDSGALNLVEVDGFVAISDPRIADFRARAGCALHRLLPFGGYAVPLSMAPPLPDAAKG
jgi:chorismate mutase / prephenate dehydratase